MKRCLLKLYARWMRYTKKRAQHRAYLDLVAYGNMVIKRNWWGYQHIPYTEFLR